VAAEVEQQIAVLKVLKQIEPRTFGLLLRLQTLCFPKELFRPRTVPRLMQRGPQGSATTHAPECIAALIGVGDALLSQRDRLGHLAQRQLQPAQIAGGDSCVQPIFLCEFAVARLALALLPP
jgi:hypothetical protein